ncbi:MAG TPA: proton-conducting transporter membrane subunit, partial [Candidatus Nanopelagicales bacterium]|nr:proton-conducting transporter membrane subunit [Candidatus Nanopelagicales bacterium]
MIATMAAVGSGVQPVDLTLLAPPLVTALGALVVLVADVLRPGAGRGPRPAPWLSWLTGAVLVVAAARLLVVSLLDSPAGTFCLGAGSGDGRVCSYDTGGPTLPLQWLVLAAGLLVVTLGAAEVERRRLPAGEYYFLLLASITGALVVVASRDLATTVVALETVTLPLVALVALSRKARGAQAALSLFLSSVVSLTVSLYGVALLYTVTGTLHYAPMAAALAAADPVPAIASLGALLVLAVFVFKVAAVPFHAWAPDTYAGSPVPVAAYLSVVSKTAGLGALAVLLSDAMPSLARSWGFGLAAVVLATFVVGNVLALRQSSLVRLLAWSSVAQLGFVLLPLAAVGVGSAGASAAAMTEAVDASVGYLAAYAAMTLACWAVVMVVVSRLRPPDGVLLIEAVRGLARTSPWLGGSLVFALAALAGLPPGVIGLLVKVRVFQSAVGSQSWLLVAVGVAATVVGLLYYLRVAAVLLAAPAPARVAPPVPATTGSEAPSPAAAGAAVAADPTGGGNAGPDPAGAVPGQVPDPTDGEQDPAITERDPVGAWFTVAAATLVLV